MEADALRRISQNERTRRRSEAREAPRQRTSSTEATQPKHGDRNRSREPALRNTGRTRAPATALGERRPVDADQFT